MVSQHVFFFERGRILFFLNLVLSCPGGQLDEFDVMAGRWGLRPCTEGLPTLTDRSATSQFFCLGQRRLRLPTEVDRLFGKQLEVFDVPVTQTHSFFVILI